MIYRIDHNAKREHDNALNFLKPSVSTEQWALERLDEALRRAQQNNEIPIQNTDD